MARWINSHHFASEGRGVAGRCTCLQYIHSGSPIKDYAKNGGESFCKDAYITSWCDFVDFGGARNNRESVEVSYKEVAAMGHCRWHDVALACRNVAAVVRLPLGSIFEIREPVALPVYGPTGGMTCSHVMGALRPWGEHPRIFGSPQ